MTPRLVQPLPAPPRRHPVPGSRRVSRPFAKSRCQSSPRSSFGILIRMFYQEHGVPHFHAEYQGEQAAFTFDGEPLAGSLRSRTALRLIHDWARAHGAELEANWERARLGQPIAAIPPLD